MRNLKLELLFASLIALFLILAGCSSDQDEASKKTSEPDIEATEENEVEEDTGEVEKSEVEEAEDKQMRIKGLVLDAYYQDDEQREYVAQYIGEKAPDFELVNMDGDKVSLKDYKGKNVILEIAMTSCPYCQQIESELVDFRKEIEKMEGIEFVQVFPDDNIKEVEKYVKEFDGIKTKHTLTGEEENEIFADYDTYAVPSFYFINEEGTIEFIHLGSLNEQVIRTLTKLMFDVDIELEVEESEGNEKEAEK